MSAPDPAVAQVVPTIVSFGEPAFLLSVDPDGSVRFVALNRAHEEQTGMRSADLAGLTPHDALPARIADTVAENYARCVSHAAPYRYEELLDLETGPKYWHTTLSPIFAAPTADHEARSDLGRVVGILGISLDITAEKAEMRRLIDALAQMRRNCDDAANAGGAIAESMRGPLSLILSLARGPEGSGPHSSSSAQTSLICSASRSEPAHPFDPTRALITKAAQTALAEIDALENVTAHVGGPSVLRCLDFGHLVRDRSALVDPEAKLSITYPRLFLRADKALLENALDRCFELVAAASASFARLTAEPMTLAFGCVRLRLTFDTGRDPATPAPEPRVEDSQALGALIRLMRRYGGAATAATDLAHGETTIDLTLPGRIDYSGPAVIAGARSEALTAPMPSERAFLALAEPHKLPRSPIVVHAADPNAQTPVGLRGRLRLPGRNRLRASG